MNKQTQPKEPEGQQDRALSIFSIIGFAVLIVLAAWLAVQVVRFIPDAFSSLASIAENMNTSQTERDLNVTTPEQTVAVDDDVAITWNDLELPGTYTFAYGCVSGVSLDVRTKDGKYTELECNTPYTIDADTFTVTVQVASERERYADVPYRITFTPQDDARDTRTTNKTLTVVNEEIPLASDDEDTGGDTDADDEETGDTPSNGTSTTRYRYIEVPQYEIPKSDPNGYTELAVSFMNTGILTNSNRFIPRDEIDRDDVGAIQFSVKNTGTKTSDTWYFTAELPSGVDYESAPQDPLKPNETMVTTVAFKNIGTEGVHEIEIEIESDADIDAHNNRITWSVEITD